MRKFILHILLIVLGFSSYAQPVMIEWQACYGTNKTEIAYDLCSTGDGYIIVGECYRSEPRIIDMLVIRTDLSGNIIWQKYIGGNSSDTPIRIFPAGNDTYCIFAISGSEDGDISFNPYDESNTWIVKINGSGDIIWDKMYGGNCLDRGWDACLTHDGGMVALGYTCSEDGDITNYFGMWDTWLLRTDSLGNKVWDFTIGTEFLDFSNAIIQTSDKGFLVASGSMPTTGGNITCIPYDLNTSDIVLFKLDSLANIEWQQCIGGSSEETVHDIIETEDGYILACSVEAEDGDMTGSGFHYGMWAGHVMSDIWIVKIDFEGNIRWHKCYGGTTRDVPNSIFPTNDGGLIIVAETESNDGDVSGKHQAHGYYSDIWVFKINANGDLLWQKCFGSSSYNRIDWSGVIDNGDGSYVIASTMDVAVGDGDVTCEATYGSRDIWLIKLRDTTVLSSKHLPKPAFTVNAYPNPANEYVVFECTKINSGIISVTDITGRQVAQVPVTGEKTVWQTANLLPGMYLYQINTGIFMVTGKILFSK